MGRTERNKGWQGPAGGKIHSDNVYPRIICA